MDLKHLEVEIEHLKEEVRQLKQQDQIQTDDYTKRLEGIEGKLDQAISQLDMYRHFTIFIRAILVGIIMIVTLRLGDISNFFSEAYNAIKG